ncbi:DedA family protein [bacterium]|nr:DedA family protein [bacterium]
MALIEQFVSFGITLVNMALHLDKHLLELVGSYGLWVYLILFLIVFAETGLVATPFLPGDSLLFASGAIAATGGLNPHLIAVILILAAFIGDTVNYWAGNFFGEKIFSREKSWFFNPEHLIKTKKFYEKHGGKTIIIARFVPIIRTFAPFVAGIGKMSYSRFISYNVIGAVLWVVTILYTGYFFGNLPFVKEHFSLVIFAIIIISILPAVIEYLRHVNEKEEEESIVQLPLISDSGKTAKESDFQE